MMNTAAGAVMPGSIPCQFPSGIAISATAMSGMGKCDPPLRRGRVGPTERYITRRVRLSSALPGATRRVDHNAAARAPAIQPFNGAPVLSVTVAAFYKFADLHDYQAMRKPLLDAMRAHAVRGTILLAHEGVNGTIAGPRDGIDHVLAHLRSDPRLRDLILKESTSDQPPFKRTMVKLKNEIVTMGVAGIDTGRDAGTYVEPKDWNKLIADPDVTVIDTRNSYEYDLGTFERAINPATDSFRQFPAYVDDKLDPAKHKRVAMFCTGGIRCEKATAYLKSRGFGEVYHLRGGILQYIQDVPRSESLWRGECFVFDARVCVDHDLKPGSYALCYACQYPISENDKRHAAYEPGVSCPRCFDKTTDEQRKRFRDRQKQVELAARRGEQHIGERA